MSRGLISITKHFEPLDDPRILLKSAHKLIDMIVIAICAVICAADTWTDIEEFGHSKIEWLKTFLELPNGIPSHDTFGRVFSLLSAKTFQECFQSWVNGVFEVTGGQVIAIDGKTARHSYDKKSNKAAIHIVHAWAADNGLLLGQLKTEEKSNEITAIPELLKMLEIKGCIVTIDAMGCQRDIAEKIIKAKADYVFTVKANQEKLEEAIKNTFTETRNTNFEGMKYSHYKSDEKGHGRKEIRTCYALSVKNLPAAEEFKKKWKGLKSIILIESERTSGGKTSIEHRYYISSLTPNAKKIALAVRKHWSVENSLHWCLDVAFKEDQCRIRIGEAAENFSLLRKIALLCLKRETSSKRGINGKRLKSGWDTKYLQKVLLE